MALYLGIGIQTFASISLVLQTVAYLILVIGFVFAKKKNFQKHKKVMASATLLSFVSLIIVMLPSFYAIISGISLAAISSSSLLIIVHHSIGLITLVLASLVILKGCRSIMKDTRTLMITIFSLWSIAFFLGVFIYAMFYMPFVF
jgi:uncharacterized membrane protein YozB (DUF420 family)